MSREVLRIATRSSPLAIWQAEYVQQRLEGLHEGLSVELVETLEKGGPYGMGWPGPRLAIGPVHIVKVDRVGSDHVRLVAGSREGGSIKAIAFRIADTDFGQALLALHPGTQVWLAGRAKVDTWANTPRAELHLEDVALALL